MLIGRCRAWIEDDPQLRPRRGARRGGMRSAGKGDEDRWRAGLSGENSNVLGPKNPGFTVFWTAGRAIAHEAEKQGVGRGEQCARASGQELTLNRQGAQGAHCAVRLRGAHWSVRGHRRPALRSARAHFERARGDKQRGSARRLLRPHLGSGTTPSNYLFDRHAQAQRGAPTPSPPLPVPLRAQLRHCAPEKFREKFRETSSTPHPLAHKRPQADQTLVLVRDLVREDYRDLQSVPEWSGHFSTGECPLALTRVPE